MKIEFSPIERRILQFVYAKVRNTKKEHIKRITKLVDTMNLDEFQEQEIQSILGQPNKTCFFVDVLQEAFKDLHPSDLWLHMYFLERIGVIQSMTYTLEGQELVVIALRLDEEGLRDLTTVATINVDKTLRNDVKKLADKYPQLDVDGLLNGLLKKNKKE